MDPEQGKLFIGGISWDTTEQTLRDYFKRYGEVVDSVIMKDKNTGSARGFGFVVFADAAVADRVVQEKHVIAGRAVDAKRAVPRGEQPQQGSQTNGNGGQIRTKKIFVGGLPANLTEDEFRKYFEQFGNITDVVVMYDNGTQRPRGFGFITFDSEEAVDSVLVKSFHELKEKLVEVKRAVPKEGSSGGGRGGFGGQGFNSNSGSGSLGGGRGPGFNSGSSLGGGAYGGGRMDSRYGAGRGGGGGGFPGYGPAGYGVAGGGYGMNGGGYGAPGYGSPGAGGYGVGPYGGAYANGPMGPPRSPWGGAAGGLSANSPSYVASAGYARGSIVGGGQSAGGYGNAAYPYGDGGYTSGVYGGGSRGAGYGAGYMGIGGGYPDGSGYSDTTWKAGGADSGFGGAPHPDGGPPGDLAGYGGGYGAAGRQSQRGPDTRFRPYPDRAG